MCFEDAVLGLQQVLAVLHQILVVVDQSAPALAGPFPLLPELVLVLPSYLQPDLEDEPELITEVGEVGLAEHGALLAVLLTVLLPAPRTAVVDEAAGGAGGGGDPCQGAPAVGTDQFPEQHN